MTLKETIIHHLEENYRDFEWSGKICRAIHDITGTKEEVISRRLRELVRTDVVEAIYERVDNSGPRSVKYRINPLVKPLREAIDRADKELLTLF